MGDDKGTGIVVAVISGLFIVLAVITYFQGRRAGYDEAKRDAVKAGAAEWINSKSGDPEFRWKGRAVD